MWLVESHSLIPRPALGRSCRATDVGLVGSFVRNVEGVRGSRTGRTAVKLRYVFGIEKTLKSLTRNTPPEPAKFSMVKRELVAPL